MTRTEAIAIITAALPGLDDVAVADLAEFVRAVAEPATPFRELTDKERAGIERSKDDFKATRTYSSDAYQAEMDGFMARMQAKYPAAT